MSKGHGARWEALLGTVDGIETRLRRMVPVADYLPQGASQTKWQMVHPEEAEFNILAWPKGPLRMAAVLRSEDASKTNEVVSAYPLMEAGEANRHVKLYFHHGRQLDQSRFCVA